MNSDVKGKHRLACACVKQPWVLLPALCKQGTVVQACHPSKGACTGWRLEGQKVKVFFSYIWSSRLAWVDFVKRKKERKTENGRALR